MVSISGVRGILGPEFNPTVVGQWIAAFSEILPPGPVVVGRDSRPSGEVLSSSASATFRACGREVWDVGIVPTPTVQLAVERWGASGGVILSASHNPAAWNALKFVDTDGGFLSPPRFIALREAHDLSASSTSAYVGAAAYAGGRERQREALDLHRTVVLELVDVARIRSARLRVVLEAGHGAGGPLLSSLAEALGLEFEGRRLEPTGNLPADPEPTERSLTEVARGLDSATHLACMVDPDADRFGLALPGTDVLGEEWTLPLAARGRLETARGPLVTNLSTSTRLEAVASRFGVDVHRTSVGEAHVVAEMRVRNALLGGEGNGGVIDPRAHLGRDSAVALALLCEAEASHPGGLRALAAELPPRFMVKEKAEIDENSSGTARIESRLTSLLGEPSDRRDGLRWSREDGFVHLRASNTEPIVRLVVETSSAEATRGLAEQIRAKF